MGSNENPQNIIRSWGLQQSFNSGRIIEDKLVPPAFGRIRSLFVGSWREQALDSTLDWGKNNVSVYLPESLLVLQSAFLKIKLPANSGAAAFKSYPAIHAVKSFRIMSAGTEVYTANVKQHLVDLLPESDVRTAEGVRRDLPRPPGDNDGCCKSPPHSHFAFQQRVPRARRS